VRRGGGHSKSFAATGWRHKGARQGHEEGSSRNARVLHSTLSAQMGSCDRPRRWHEGLRLPAESTWLAADGSFSPEMDIAQTQEKHAPREGFEIPMRARMTALEGVPVRRNWSAEVGSRRRPKKRVPNV